MTKIFFLPFRVLAGAFAGAVAKRLFEGLWSLVEHETPPDPKHRDVPWKKVVPALLIQGAVFGAARGITDRASREAFSRLTGAWPGEEREEPSEAAA
jgi:Protein of unknown function (DUF4235)